MRIISPTGKLYQVAKIVPYVEERRTFNGKTIRYEEAAKDLSVRPTGLNFSFDREESCFFIPSLYIGNLKPEKVQEIISSVMRDDYYDFSSLEYQKKVINSSKYVADNGMSLPFFEEFFCESMGTFGQSMGVRNVPYENDDLFNEKDEDFFDEEGDDYGEDI